MSSVSPVPNTRITGLLARQRLTKQFQNDQLDLFRLQEQISTGLRITLPSQDAPAALRAISFQRLLDRKEQLGSNINSGLQFLASTDATLGGDKGVADTLSQIKADTLGVIGTDATDQDRQAAVETINGAINSLVALGNRQFNGRYLFAGSQTSQQPYSFEGDNVIYHGNDREIQNYSDIGVLFSSNISGQEVFGGVSAAVEGKTDLNPPVTADTLLSSLRGGRGINPNGSLLISDATTNQSAIVDLSSATTIGDIVKLIQDSPPAAAEVDVTITGDGIQVELVSGNLLVIGEVGTGTTARELGLLGSGSPATLVSEDLDPQLIKTTRLDDLLGTKARAVLKSGADNNDIFLEASSNGLALDGVTVEIVETAGFGLTPDAQYNAGTLTIEVDDNGEVTANQVIEAINAEGTFRAELDRGDTSVASQAGTGFVSAGSTTTSGGSGETLDQSSGIRVVNGGNSFDISFAGDETIEDLLNTLNLSEAGLLAEVNAAGTGINVRSKLSGHDFQIGEVDGGTTATQLGIRTYGTETKLRDFNYGVGVPTKDALDLNFHLADVTFITSDDSQFTVDLSGATDAASAILAINSHVDNVGLVTAQPTADGGIELVDGTTGTKRLSFTQAGAPIGALPSGLDVTVPAIDLNITAREGSTLALDFSSAETVGDILGLINNHAGNDDGSGNLLVEARLAQSGNGIELVDHTAAGDITGELTVTKIGGSQAAEFLGLIDRNETTQSSSTATLTGTDRHALENESVFNSLIRLRDALDVNDLPAIERAAAKLDADIERVTFAQADVGSRFRNLELAKFNLADEEIQLRSALSDEVDVDMVEAISQMTARQISLEASLRATANILQLSLLNFI